MSKDRDAELADWLRYTEDPDYISLPTYATTKETQPPEPAFVEDDLL